jgi:hypothetical protein
LEFAISLTGNFASIGVLDNELEHFGKRSNPGMQLDWMTIVAIIVILIGIGYLVMKRRSKA